MVSRTKPTKGMLKATKPAGKRQYAQMVAAASEVVVRNRNASLANQGRSVGSDYVLIEFPYFVKFGEDFPKGVLVSSDGLTDVRKINAVRLLDWLYENGHSRYNAKQVVLETKQYEVLDNSIDTMFNLL